MHWLQKLTYITSLPSSSMEREPLQELEVNERLEEHHSCNSNKAAATTGVSDDDEHYSSLQNEAEEQMSDIFEEVATVKLGVRVRTVTKSNKCPYHKIQYSIFVSLITDYEIRFLCGCIRTYKVGPLSKNG